MNIFALDRDPRVAACSLHTKHLNKMLIESCQMLMTSLYYREGITTSKQFEESLVSLQEKYHDFPRRDKDPSVPRLYGFAFVNHPCSVWVRTTQANTRWLYEHAREMSRLFTLHYGKIHSCDKVLDWYERFIVDDGSELTPFALAMPETYRVDNEVQSYRNYYIAEKHNDKRVYPGGIPKWLTEMQARYSLV